MILSEVDLTFYAIESGSIQINVLVSSLRK